MLVEKAHDLFIGEDGRRDGAFFWTIVNGFLVADHENIDVDIIDFGECFKIFESGFAESAFESGVFRLRDAESFCDEFLFEVVKNSEFSDFRISDHVFRDFGFFDVFDGCFIHETNMGTKKPAGAGFRNFRRDAFYSNEMQLYIKFSILDGMGAKPNLVHVSRAC